MNSTPPTAPTGPHPGAPGQVPPPADTLRPRLFNGATIHGMMGIRQLRHRFEIPLVIVGFLITILLYAGWLVTLVWLVAEPSPTGTAAETRSYILEGGEITQLLLLLPLLPIIIWGARAILYAKQRATAIQMSPTQFPEGYRMVVEAAQSFGLRRVPDAYVVLGHGQINAFAAGHGFRRFVAVNSDLFEVGGKARDPEALRFVIGHEVGHQAAGHTSFGRTLLMSLMSQILLLGPALSRAQEYTADNHGYSQAPQGVPGAIGLLGAGKYLGAQVNLHAVADRATRERGLWLHLAVWGASHPVLTWRAHALRDRSRHGRLMIRPPESTAWFPPVQPPGSSWSKTWPTPGQALARLDSTRPRVQAEEQFGRYPGVEYQVPRNELRLADPVPVPVAPGSQGTGVVPNPLFGAPGRGGAGGPARPGWPGGPGGPGMPGGPGGPGVPGGPDGPVGPTGAHTGGPVVPSAPGDPGVPGTPGMADGSAGPGIPGGLGGPGTSGGPGVPGEPGDSGAGTAGPHTGGLSSSPGVPAPHSTPGAHGAPVSPDAPVSSPAGAPVEPASGHAAASSAWAPPGGTEGTAPVVSDGAWRSPGEPAGAHSGLGGYGITPARLPSDAQPAQSAQHPDQEPGPEQSRPSDPSAAGEPSEMSQPDEPAAQPEAPGDSASPVEPTEAGKSVGAQDSAAAEEPAHTEGPAEQTGTEEEGTTQPEAPGDPEGAVKPTEAGKSVGAQDSAAAGKPAHAEKPAEQTGTEEEGTTQPEAPGDPENPVDPEGPYAPEDPEDAEHP